MLSDNYKPLPELPIHSNPVYNKLTALHIKDAFTASLQTSVPQTSIYFTAFTACANWK
jgi:hypothetical protein